MARVREPKIKLCTQLSESTGVEFQEAAGAGGVQSIDGGSAKRCVFRPRKV
jgi:hypothetical protein